MQAAATTTPGIIVDVAGTMRGTRALDGIVALRDEGDGHRGGVAALASPVGNSLTPELLTPSERVTAIPTMPMPEASKAAYEAWDRELAEAGLHIVAFDTRVVVRRCWQPPAVVLTADALIGLRDEIDAVIRSHDQKTAWATMPVKVEADVAALSVAPMAQPRTRSEHALFRDMGDVWQRHLAPHLVWFAELGPTAVLRLHAPGAREPATVKPWRRPLQPPSDIPGSA